MEDNSQEATLDTCRTDVKKHAFYMKRALESANLRQTLIHAARMLKQLNTGDLNPRNYYILFMQVFDEMRILEAHFREEHRRGRNIKDLYEAVQYC